MCGICGELFLNDNPVTGRSVEKMNPAMAMRGPDHEASVESAWVPSGTGV